MPASEPGIRVVSTHPAVVRGLTAIISQDRKLKALLLAPVTSQELPVRNPGPSVFVIDALTSPMRLSALARTLRVRNQESRFVALVLPEEGDKDSLLRLLHGGIEGVVLLSEGFETELLRTIPAVMDGEQWAPPDVLAEFLDQSRMILDQQILPHLSLTARENQVLHLMIRRFSNNEIAEAIGISERTVRFHVSNIFSKLRVQDRRNLLATLAGLEHQRT